jgi:hypothetical protein
MAGEAAGLGCQWRLDILRELRQRNKRESGGFSELIASHGKLQEQLNAVQKEITRLEYQNNELDQWEFRRER